MKFNGIRLPESLVRAAATEAVLDAEDAMTAARQQLRRRLKQHEVMVVHRKTREKLDLARSLQRHLKGVA